MKRNRLPRRAVGTATPLGVVAQERAQLHLHLARRLAWRFFQGCARTVPHEELEGEAMYALAYAAGMFDEARGVPFGAYATMAIQHRLIQAITQWRHHGRSVLVRFTDLSATNAVGLITEFDAACPRTREAYEAVAADDLLERIQRLLPPRWFLVLKMHHLMGFTLDEVGQHLNLTRERIRQLLNKSIVRLQRRLPHHLTEMDVQQSA